MTCTTTVGPRRRFGSSPTQSAPREMFWNTQ